MIGSKETAIDTHSHDQFERVLVDPNGRLVLLNHDMMMMSEERGMSQGWSLPQCQRRKTSDGRDVRQGAAPNVTRTDTDHLVLQYPDALMRLLSHFSRTTITQCPSQKSGLIYIELVD